MILSADGLKLSVSVVADGPLLDSDRMERLFRETYEDDGLEVSRQAEAVVKATYVFRIVDVFDDLVPTSSEVVLCQGTCEIEIRHEDEEVLRRTLRSKVISGRDRSEIHRTITDSLMKSAYRDSVKALDEVVCE